MLQDFCKIFDVEKCVTITTRRITIMHFLICLMCKKEKKRKEKNRKEKKRIEKKRKEKKERKTKILLKNEACMHFF